MEAKTKDAIAGVMNVYADNGMEESEALAKICAIVDEERKVEVVLGEGVFNHDASVCELTVSRSWHEVFNCGFDEIHGKKGRLIFVPEGEKCL